MLEKLKIVFTKIPELRQKILLTLLLLGIYRIGYQIRLPILKHNDVDVNGTFNSFFEKVSMFAATDLRTLSIFGLGIMPYISASIIFQLLGTVWRPIEQLRKEGQTGIKKINEYTRYLTVVICVIQSYFFLNLMIGSAGSSRVSEQFYGADGTLSFGWQVTLVTVMTCGTMFLMWLGEQIDEYGIGNGISLLIMAGILVQMPNALWNLRNSMQGSLSGFSPGQIGPDNIIVLFCLFIVVVFAVVFITQAQRRIPTQSAKHVKGRKVYGGTKQYLPLKINQSGVMPIIFASSLLMIPSVLLQVMVPWFRDTSGDDLTFNNRFAAGLHFAQTTLSNQSSFIYNLLYVFLIFFFCFFWTSITFNPKEMSENLKDHGTFIPGYRPGKRTADYLERVMLRITYVGAAFLSVVAIVPTLVTGQFGVSFSVAAFYGGTGLLIAVSVAFDLIQKIDSHLLMRNYSGLLES